MDKELITRYAPIILIVFVMFFQYNLFVTPRELEIQHRQILETVSQKKVDKIYDVIIGGKE